MELTKEQGGKQSTTRAAFLFVAIPIAFVIVSAGAVVLSSIWTGEQVDYNGVSVLIGSMTAPLTGVGAVKVFQKKYEK
jgi:hypothetical protein